MNKRHAKKIAYMIIVSLLLLSTISHITPSTLGYTYKIQSAEGKARARFVDFDTSNITIEASSPLLVNPSIPYDMGLNKLHAMGMFGKNITIAVLDSGVNPNDERFDRDGLSTTTDDRVIKVSRSFVPGEDIYDYNGHGTMVSGIIGARYVSDDNITMGGIAPEADIWNIKVIDMNGTGEDAWIVNGLDYVLQHADQVDIISMSLGDSFSHLAEVEEKVKECWDAGIVVVCAGGNNGAKDPSDPPTFYTIASPGSLLEPISVGATVDSNWLAWFSSNGPSPVTKIYKPEIVAPGVSILSTSKNFGYTHASGTSMSTPIVAAGLACVMSGLKEKPSPDMLKAALVTYTKSLEYEDPYMEGNGIPNFYDIWYALNTSTFNGVSTVPKSLKFPNIFDAEKEGPEIDNLDYMRITLIIGNDLQLPVSINVSDSISKFIRIKNNYTEIRREGQYVIGIDFVEHSLMFERAGTYMGKVMFESGDRVYTYIPINVTISISGIIKSSLVYIGALIGATVIVATVVIEKLVRKGMKIEKANEFTCPEGEICACTTDGSYCYVVSKVMPSLVDKSTY